MPPASPARSTITLPGFIAFAASAVISFGAGRPGTSAVVITTSDFAICAASASRCACCSSSVSSRAYPPAASASAEPSTSRNFAPSDCTCSLTAARTSNAVTTAPSRRAVAIACSPATPAPSTSTWAGGIVPAAVISIGKNRPCSSAAISTARYPDTVACEDSASIDCAREIRGIASIANAVAPVCASAALPGPFVSGARKPTSTDSAPSRADSSGAGGATFATTSADQAPSPSLAPAASNRASGIPAASPAPGSTTTSCPWPASLRTTSGTSATRRSPSAVSLGTPISTEAATYTSVRR